MAFTQTELQTEFVADGPNCVITRFDAAGALATDVFIQNLNINSAHKSGWTQVAQTNTAAQAATAIRANLT
jgi:hypothetical protein